MGRPSIATTRSPGWKPAVAATLFGCTLSTRAEVICLPKTMNTAAKIRIASRKLASGPAATMATLWPTDLCTKLWCRSSGVMAAIAA
jgi:hypothetical protein